MNVYLLTSLLIVVNLALIQGLTIETAITRFFDYFKQDEPQGIPVLDFAEPMDLLTPLEIIPITLVNGTLLGHSNLSFIHVIVDLMELKAELKMSDPRLEIGGIFIWPGFFSQSVGDMNGTIIEPVITTNFTMFVDENDTLQIADAGLNLENEELFLNMSDLIWEHQLLMATGSVEIFFGEIVQESFRQMKPLLLHEANKGLKEFVSNMPHVEHPSEVENRPSLKYFLQRIMTYLGLEPLNLPDRHSKILGINFKVTDMVLHGLSVVSEIKSLFFTYHFKKFYFEYEMVYPKLLLFYQLGLSSGSYLNFDLFEKNQLNGVNLRIKLIIDPSQKNPPLIKDLNIDIDSFGKMRSGRNRGFFDTVKNFFLDVADDVRNEIVGALTGPIKNIIQNELNKMDMEKITQFLGQMNRK